MRHIAPVALVLTLAASISALDRAGRRYLAGAVAVTLGGAAVILCGASAVSLVGGLVAAAGSLTMARHGPAAGADA